MKCRVMMKCPDSLEDAIREFVDGIIDIPINTNESSSDYENDYDYEHERLVERYKEKANKWFKWGELVTLEIDFDEDTCTVVKA